MSKTEEEPFVNENGLPLLSSLFHLPFVAINNIYLTFTKHLFYTHKTAKNDNHKTFIWYLQDIYSTFTKLPNNSFKKQLLDIHKTAEKDIHKVARKHQQIWKNGKSKCSSEDLHICKIVFLITFWGNGVVKV